MRVLHITNWFPSPKDPYEAPFINEHFNATIGRNEQQLWHVQVRESKSLFSLKMGRYSINKNYLLIYTCLNQSLIIEIFTLGLLILLRIRLSHQQWDLTNVHIAYPLLRFPSLVQWLFGKSLLITEHWSAYRRNFDLPVGSPGKKRLQQMFHHGIPVLTVSKTLMQDIIKFSEKNDFQKYVIPNVVDPSIFYAAVDTKKNKNTFLMIANWAPVKRPLLVLGAFKEVISIWPDLHLKIIGHGYQSKAMLDYVSLHNLTKFVTFLGPLPKTAIAHEMRRAEALLHASDYETFSVVCAEALCCGLPVIASNVGGIPEFVNDSNGILVDNTQPAWISALRRYLLRTEAWSHHGISKSACDRFSPDTVGHQLAMAYAECSLGKNAVR